MRSLFNTEEERHRAAEEYFEEVFSDQLKEKQAEGEAKLAKARRVANMFRYVCPSFYIPGKQDWGAF